MENKTYEVMDLDGWQFMFSECDEWPKDLVDEPEKNENAGGYVPC
jgi:hypothetical protein